MATKEQAAQLETEPKIAPPDPVIQQKVAEVDKDTSVARSRQEALLRTLKDRKTMPFGLAVGMSKAEPDVELLRRVAPECLEPWVRENRSQTDDERRQSRGVFHWGATHRSHMDTKENHNKNIQNGWEPIREADGTQAMYGSCLVYRRPVELSRAAIGQVEMLSDDRVRAQDDNLQSAAGDIGQGLTVTADEAVVTKRNMREVQGFTLKD